MKYFLLLILCCILSGCSVEYIYIDQPYSYNSCTYTDMRYIKEYVNNKKNYKNFDHYMEVNYSKRLNYNRNISNF